MVDCICVKCFFHFGSSSMLPLCQVPISALISFVDSLEVGYSKYKNPYHNLMHAADVTQTIHFLLLKTGMVVSLTLVNAKRTVQLCELYPQKDGL